MQHKTATLRTACIIAITTFTGVGVTISEVVSAKNDGPPMRRD